MEQNKKDELILNILKQFENAGYKLSNPKDLDICSDIKPTLSKVIEKICSLNRILDSVNKDDTNYPAINNLHSEIISDIKSLRIEHLFRYSIYPTGTKKIDIL